MPPEDIRMPDPADVERRTRANCRDEARGALARLNQFGVDQDYRSLLTLAELKTIGAAEETLREIIRRLSQ
jgi:hypothetical protein